jgi:soluble lytic murein transglycosylase-like protein
MRIRIQIRLFTTVLVLSALWCLPGWAAENAVLRNGFSIRHERREVIGPVTRLFVGTDSASYVDIPTEEIERFEDAPSEVTAAPLQIEPNVAAQSSARPADLSQVVASASDRYRLDPDLVNSVIKAESGFNVRAVSNKGAQGLMQLMPGTASMLGVPNSFDPEANVQAGTRYLRELLERYDFDLVKALAAYNAGPKRVEQYGGVPPYYETRAYVARIVKDFNRKKTIQQNAALAAARAAKTKAKKPTATPTSGPTTLRPAAQGTPIATVSGPPTPTQSSH